MKRIPVFLLIVGFLFLANKINPGRVSAQGALTPPVEVLAPVSPIPLKADGKYSLFYELHITNFRPQNLQLTRVDIFDDRANQLPLASYKDKDLVDRLARPGMTDLPDKRNISGGLRAIVFLQITFNTESGIPRSLHHRIFFAADASNPNTEERFVDGPVVTVQRKPQFVISAPLRGEGWLAANGISNNSGHRRALLLVEGKSPIAQRFATDWIKLGADGKAFHDNPANNANWYGYRAEVLAVADATVVEVKDDLPENEPLSPKRAIPITLDTLGGNSVLLDLGKGYFAIYAHLQPKSLRVKVGDKVKQGQVLGLLGNSGNSDAPHLHFHITGERSPFGSEGVPFVFDSFDVQGQVKSLDGLLSGEVWKQNAKPDRRRAEMSVDNMVIRFP